MAEKLDFNKTAGVIKRKAQKHLEQTDVKCVCGEMFPLEKKKEKRKMRERKKKKGSSRVTALLTQDAVTPHGGADRQIPADVEME